MSAVIIICTRTQSRRLPGKANKRIAGLTSIEHILNRVRPTGLPIILAIPSRDYIDLDGEALRDIVVYRGSSDLEDASPLHRTAAAMKLFPDRDYVVRITHDDILIDAHTVTNLVAHCVKADAGYGITPGIIEGAGVEVIHRDNIAFAADKRKEATEFISYFVRGDSMPKSLNVALQPRHSITRPYRLTMDYHEDAVVLEAVLRAVGPKAKLDDVANYVDRNQYLLSVNRLPELSIYTCAYNAQDWIGTAMCSVLATRSVPIEHIVVDDGSTDETLTKASVFWRDRQRIIVNEKNLGLASSSNIALNECRGKYVLRLDADDHLLNSQFESAFPKIKQMLEDGDQVVYMSYLESSDSGISEPKDPRINHHAGGAIFDKSFLNELRFRDGIRHWDGKELFARLQKVGARIGYYDRPTWVYRQHSDSMSKSETAKREKIAAAIEAGCEDIPED